ncbi:TetR/AcrR family transcriptional regulator [Rhodococcus koreensis]|uniref:TetR/AcrR family transcriptional regulator n=1 Tax=Rhodococcus koreensis TaxID=99653 RepID=UPI00197DE954|nr:TetR/AcrR family transcriptional regulator [Rhodococcus koreensis]QSE81061.1 TetR/AcrR family transcriptional regulator [Rhodococcus koreensis]
MNQSLSTPTQRTEDRSAQIVEAAAVLFRQRGFVGVGIDDIGAALELSGPAVYRYFSSKQAILAAVIGRHLTEMESARESADADMPLQERVLRASVLTCLADPDAHVVYLRQMGNLDPASRDELTRRQESIVAPWSSLLDPEDLGASLGLRLRASAGVLIRVALSTQSAKLPRERLAAGMVRSLLSTTLPASASVATPTDSDATAPGPLRHASRREAILTVSTQLFRERGFGGVSLRDIGDQVGVTASAVSRNFDNKEQLLAAAFNRAGEQIAGAIATALRHAGSASEAVVDIVARYATLAIESRDLIAIYTTEMHSLPENVRALRRRSQRMYVDELAHVIELAVPDLSAAEAKVRAGCAYSLINEVIINDGLAQRPNLAEELTMLAIDVTGLNLR